MPLRFFASDGRQLGSAEQLEALTVAGDARSLRLLADFLAKAADEIQAGKVTMSHLAFNDEPEVLSEPDFLPQVFVSRCV